jgi:hypothetical protein
MKNAKFFIASLALCFVWATNVYGQNQQTHLNPYVFWPVKNSQNMVRVIDSVVYSWYNSTTMDWDKTSKDVVISRHWGTEGWPHELITFSYDQASLSWTPYRYSEIQYFPNHKIKNFLEKRYHTFLQQFKDTTYFIEFSPKVSQWGDSISTLEQYALYNSNTNAIDGGYKFISTMLNDSQLLNFAEYQYNTATATYNIPISMTTYDYNDQHLISLITQLSWDNSLQTYVNHQRVFYQYTPEKLVKAEISQNFSSGSWHNSEKDEKSYYPNGLLKTLTIYYPDGSDVFKPFSKDTLIYTYSNKISKRISYLWNDATSTWINDCRSSYTYNTQDLDIQYLYETWDGTNWIYSNKIEKTYNTQGNLLTYNYYYYDKGSSSWVNSIRIVDQYDPSGLYITEEIHYTGNPLTPSYRVTVSYDSYNNKLDETLYSWDNGTSSWEPTDKTEYYWSDWDANALIEMSDMNILIYPNPCDNLLNISFNKQIKEINIYDVYGKKLLTENVTFPDHQTLDLSSLQKGFYILDFITTDNLKVQKSFIKN